MGQVVSLNKSSKKGVKKEPVDGCVIKENHGIVGDAHAGNPRRQVSFLALESIKRFEERHNIQVDFGDFAENITTQGIDIQGLEKGDKLSMGETLHVVSQVGKQCHEGCVIREKVGSCIMPSEGVFTKVLEGGEVERGDEISLAELCD